MRRLRCADRTLTFEHPRIMGVLNVTPDSFSDGGTLYAAGKPLLDKIADVAAGMMEAGVDVLDIGGESTRPGAVPVNADEEVERVVPVVEHLRDCGAVISVDTRHARVAAAAIEAGAHLINDVSGGADSAMLELIAASEVGYALMHMQGAPATMQDNPVYADVVTDVHAYLAAQVATCQANGIALDRLMVDPGFGFGKTLDHNLLLLSQLERTRVADLPLLVGLSRKRMLGTITGREVGDRTVASVAAALLAAERGADLVRVHDVAATADAFKLLAAVRDVRVV